MYSNTAAASIPTPPPGYINLFVETTTKHLSQKNDAGAVIDLTATGGEAPAAYRDYILGDPGSDPDIGRVRLYFDTDGILRALDSSGASVSVYDDGHDIDANGNHLLNDQTTTNMMSKGTAYRFDGDDDFVNLDALAVDLVNVNNTKGTIVWAGKINDLTTDNDMLWAFGDTNGDEYIILKVNPADNILTAQCRVAGTSKWDFSIDVAVAEDIEYEIVIVQDGTAPVMYIDGILQSITFTVSIDQTSWFHETTAIDNGRLGCLNYTSGGDVFFSEAEVNHFGYFNTALTASEVKDLSANTPYKWIGASQTELMTNGDAEAFTGGLADGWADNSASHTQAEENTIFHSGTSSQKVTAGNTNDINGGFFNNKAFIIGKSYNYSAWAYSATASRSMQLLIRDNANGEQVSDTRNVTAGWTQFSGTFIATATATTGDFFITVAPTTSDVYYFDDLSMTQAGVTADYPSHGISETHWTDASGNNNDGDVTGCEVLNQTDGQAFKNIILSPVGQDATPKEGQLIYNSATNKLNVWTGAAWEVVTSA